MEEKLQLKRKQFNLAMEQYEKNKIYKMIGKITSLINIIIQLSMIIIIYFNNISLNLYFHISILIITYILADLVNGFIHMYMDNNDNYESIFGPLIASFHLHHKKPLYKRNNIILVYFNEAGSKIWLGILSIIFILTFYFFKLSPSIIYFVLYFSLFSSIAEVSHYLCHVSNSKIADVFRKLGLLLNKKHHGRHHIEDNINYAFLNGVSDPIINIIASKYYKGYKNGTDLHYANYMGVGTENR